jgi:hypothetical protein
MVGSWQVRWGHELDGSHFAPRALRVDVDARRGDVD